MADTLSCPICSTPLAEDAHEGITCGSCPAGHGIFVTHDALRAMVQQRGEDQPDAAEDAALRASVEPQAQDQGARACPQCSRAMDRLNYAYESGVTIDSCSQHGLWLDAGELQRIEAWVEGSERLASQEEQAWRGKLNAIEVEQDSSMARATGALHWGPVGWVLRNASRWELARNDQH